MNSEYEKAKNKLIAHVAYLKERSRLYEELRTIIDGGNESMTHNDAVAYLKSLMNGESNGR